MYYPTNSNIAKLRRLGFDIPKSIFDIKDMDDRRRRLVPILDKELPLSKKGEVSND